MSSNTRFSSSWHLAVPYVKQAHPCRSVAIGQISKDFVLRLDKGCFATISRATLRVCTLITVSLTTTRLPFLSQCRDLEIWSIILQALVVIVPEHVSEFSMVFDFLDLLSFASCLTNYPQALYGSRVSTFPADQNVFSCYKLNWLSVFIHFFSKDHGFYHPSCVVASFPITCTRLGHIIMDNFITQTPVVSVDRVSFRTSVPGTSYRGLPTNESCTILESHEP